MRNKSHIIYAFLCMALTAVSAAAPAGDAQEVPFELAPEVEALIEHYQTDEYLEGVMRDTAKYQEHDFIYEAMYPREAQWKNLEDFNKTLLLDVPFISGEKTTAFLALQRSKIEYQRLGLFVSDVINFGAYATQWYIDKKSIQAVLPNLAKNLAATMLEQYAEMLMLFEDDSIDPEHLINSVWEKSGTIAKLNPYLKCRLAYAASTCLQKQIVLPPVFLHKKTTAAQERDAQLANIFSVTSVMPLVCIMVHTVEFITRQKLISSHIRLSSGLYSFSEFLLEAGKQQEIIGTVDDNLLVVAARELFVSMMFFRRSLKRDVRRIMGLALVEHKDALRSILREYRAAQNNAALSIEARDAEQKEYFNQLVLFFEQTLQDNAKTFEKSLLASRDLYNTLINWAFLAPAIYKACIFCSNFFTTPSVKQPEPTTNPV